MSLVSRMLNAKFKLDEAESRLPMSMGRAVGFTKYCEINKQKICTRVFAFLHTWVMYYYSEDFAHDEVLQGMLHGFVEWLRGQKLSEESHKLMDVWTTQRKMHQGVVDAQTLRSSTWVATPSWARKILHAKCKKTPPPPPMLLRASTRTSSASYPT